MATSQFNFYYSSDAGATGSIVINGLSGSLLNVLNKCLVEGYVGRTASGWTKPIADTGNVGIFKQGILSDGTNNGYLHVMDNGPGAGGAIEARITGWENITAFSTASGGVTGSGQYPTSTQLAIGSGACIARKSIAATSVQRNWIVAADSRSVYMFIQSEGTTVYFGWMFGDIYSYKSSDQGIDAYRQIIIGRVTENSTDVNTAGRLDKQTIIGTVNTGHFASRTYSGLASGVTLSKHGDWTKSAGSGIFNGVVPFPNGPDGATYLSKIWIGENASSVLRGHMKGFWHWCHPVANITDQQIISGSGTLAGRTFLAIKSTESLGVYIMETSNTIENN